MSVSIEVWRVGPPRTAWVVISTSWILNAYRLFLVLTILRLVAVTVDRILLHVTADSPIVRGPPRPIEPE
jgi:hypothetical protein